MPTAITDMYNVPVQQMLPPLSSVDSEATEALFIVIQKVRLSSGILEEASVLCRRLTAGRCPDVKYFDCN